MGLSTDIALDVPSFAWNLFQLTSLRGLQKAALCFCWVPCQLLRQAAEGLEEADNAVVACYLLCTCLQPVASAMPIMTW